MEFRTFVFYFLAVILVFASLRVITLRNPVHAALHLVLAFFSAAGVWLLLQAEFLAIALILVYVGAVMVLFLFVVMLLDINLDRLREGARVAVIDASAATRADEAAQDAGVRRAALLRSLTQAERDKLATMAPDERRAFLRARRTQQADGAAAPASAAASAASAAR